VLHQLFIFLHTSKYLAQNYTQDGLIAGQGMNKKWKWIAGLVFVGILLGGALALSSM